MELIIVRHGQTQWNRIERFRGQADVPLNETGLAQAEATAQKIASLWHPQAIFSSPLSRALVTAQKIALSTGLKAQPLAGLMDINFGDWQGLSIDEARDRWPDQIDNYLHKTHAVVIPGGGSLSGVQEAALQAIDNIARDYSTGSVVLVSHTVVIRLVLLGMLGLDLDHFWSIRQDNCAINVVHAENSQYILVTMNDTCHLSN